MNHSCILASSRSSYLLVMRRTSSRVSSERLTQKTCRTTSVSLVVDSLRFPMPIFDSVSQILNLNSSMLFSKFFVFVII
jgi:hypothetical protein